MREIAKVVAKVIAESCKGGFVRRYYEDAREWEGPLRKGFEVLRGRLGNGRDDSSVVDEADGLVRTLIGRYHAGRLSPVGRQGFCRVVFHQVRHRRWLEGEPPSLFSTDDCSALAEAVPQILAALHGDPDVGTCYYVLLTKFLYFLFPDSFPMCDSQAAASIQTWSRLEFREDHPKEYASENLTRTGGEGYSWVVKFYRTFWDNASQDQRKELIGQAMELSRDIGGTVTAPDLVDKLLWLGKGDRALLGLPEPR